MMNDYTKDLYKAISCKTPTKGSEFYVDDFGDLWLLIPQLNRFGEQSVFRQYAGNLTIQGKPGGMFSNATYIGQFMPTYHLFLVGQTTAIDIAALQRYVMTRASKVVARYQRKAKPFQGAYNGR
jgi:hypothetical protein